MKIDVATYISQLLFEHDCVIIPSFGGFITNYQPASIDFGQGNLHPPTKSITFNNSLTLNDGLLINYIARKEYISYEEARTQVENYAQECKNTLQRKEILAIPKVGKLYNDVENNLQFLPDASNFLTDSFGLPKLQYYPILRSSIERQEDQYAEKYSVSKPVKTLAQNELKPMENMEQQSASAKKSEFNSGLFILRMIPYAAAACILFFVSFVGWNIYQNPQHLNNISFEQPLEEEGDIDYINNDSQAGIITMSESLQVDKVTEPEENFEETQEETVVEETPEETEEVTQEDSDISSLNEEEQEKIVKEAVKEEEEEDVATDNGEFKGMTKEEKQAKLSAVNETLFSVYSKDYTIVVGCFGAKENATNLEKRLADDGMETAMGKHGRLHRVGVKVKCEPKDLQSNLEEIRSKYGKNAWVL